MADITLAEFNGRVWLVSGESYIDDLLANRLSEDVSIEFVRCESQRDIRDLWVQNCGSPEAGTGSAPWAIHPKIAERIRRSSPDYAVFFAQWSAMLDHDALAVIRAAVVWWKQQPQTPVVLAEYLDPDGPQAMVDLSRLRAQLIEEKLAEGGVAREQISRLRRSVHDVPGMAQESQRVDIIVRPV
jgi:outer membrane protein OmpA-like peptidoglycan-associated protein